jgi:hypothetical protein
VDKHASSGATLVDEAARLCEVLYHVVSLRVQTWQMEIGKVPKKKK